MGSWRKVGAFLGLVPDEGRRDEFGDDYPDSDGYHDDYDPAENHSGEKYGAEKYGAETYGADGYGHPYQAGEFDRGRAPLPVQRSVPGGYQEEPMTHGALAVQARPEQRRDQESAAAIRPVTVKLTGFGEARVIGEKFREGKPVILDMTEMDDAGARRLVDFAAGLAFALRGSIDKVTTKVFMLLPPDTDAADIPAYEPAHTGFTGGFAGDAPARDRPTYATGRR